MVLPAFHIEAKQIAHLQGSCFYSTDAANPC